MYCRRKPVRHREISDFSRRMPRFDLAQIRQEIRELSEAPEASPSRAAGRAVAPSKSLTVSDRSLNSPKLSVRAPIHIVRPMHSDTLKP